MKRILLVSHSFPPLLTANSIQIGRWAKELASRGYVLDVISVEPRFTLDKPGIAPLDLPNVRVYRAFSLESILERLKVSGLIRRLLPSLTAIPDRQALWTPFAISRIRQEIHSRQFSSMISCSHYLSNHIAVNSVIRHCRSLPWIAHFSDPWTDSIYFPTISEWQKEWNRKKEHEIIMRSDYLTFPCGELRDLVMSKYPAPDLVKKSRIIPHSYDRKLYRRLGEDMGAGRREKVRFVHTGSFYGPRSPFPLLEALQILNREDAGSGYECILVGVDKRYDRAISRMGLDSIVKTIPRVSYEESISYILSADILILIDAPCEDRMSIFFPSKLADYLGSGIPIIGISPPGSASARILRDMGQTSLDINDRKGIASHLRLIIRKELKLKRYEPPPEYSIERVGDDLTALIEEATSDRAKS